MKPPWCWRGPRFRYMYQIVFGTRTCLPSGICSCCLVFGTCTNLRCYFEDATRTPRFVFLTLVISSIRLQIVSICSLLWYFAPHQFQIRYMYQFRVFCKFVFLTQLAIPVHVPFCFVFCTCTNSRCSGTCTILCGFRYMYQFVWFPIHVPCFAVCSACAHVSRQRPTMCFVCCV